MEAPLPPGLPVWLVDAFAATPFTGNPAAVVLLPPGAHLDDELRQRIAAELNQSETAFVEALEGAEEEAEGQEDVFATAGAFRLRWFTPTTEVPLCGHATLAAAATIMHARKNPQPSLSFHTRSGELVVRRAPAVPAQASAAPPLMLSLSMPLRDPVDTVPACAADAAAPLIRACVGSSNPVADIRFCARGCLNYLLLVLGGGVGRQQLEALRPDYGAMVAAAGKDEVAGVIVCVRTAEGAAAGEDRNAPHVCSRFFAPAMGIPEDPVTGSAHAVLGPYWQAELGGDVMRMRQCSPRGGDVLVEVLRAEDRVVVTGAACVVLEGLLRL